MSPLVIWLDLDTYTKIFKNCYIDIIAVPMWNTTLLMTSSRRLKNVRTPAWWGPWGNMAQMHVFDPFEMKGFRQQRRYRSLQVSNKIIQKLLGLLEFWIGSWVLNSNLSGWCTRLYATCETLGSTIISAMKTHPHKHKSSILIHWATDNLPPSTLLSQRLFFPPLLLSALLLSPLHKVLDIFSQSDGLYDGPHLSGHFGPDQLVEGQLRVPVAPNGSAVRLFKVLPACVRPGEAGNLHQWVKRHYRK